MAAIHNYGPYVPLYVIVEDFQSGLVGRSDYDGSFAVNCTLTQQLSTTASPSAIDYLGLLFDLFRL